MHVDDYDTLAKDHTADAGQTEAGSVEAVTSAIKLDDNQNPIGPNTINLTPWYIRKFFMPNYASAQSGSVFHPNNERAISNRVYEANNVRIDSFNSFVDCVLLHEVVVPYRFSKEDIG